MQLEARACREWDKLLATPYGTVWTSVKLFNLPDLQFNHLQSENNICLPGCVMKT